MSSAFKTSEDGWAKLRLLLEQLWTLVENPVMGREFRSRMRGARSFIITGVYCAVVMLLVLAAYWRLVEAAANGPMNEGAAELGRGIWTWGCMVQALLLPLIVPAFTCGSVTREREHAMLELLLLTRQSAVKICLGKLGSGVGLGLILVLSSVPVLSLCMLLGGVALEEIGAGLAVLVTAVVVSGAFGLVVSTMVNRTVTATVVSYLGVGTAMLGMPVLVGILGGVEPTSGSEVGILLMLACGLLTALPPAVALTSLQYSIIQMRSSRVLERSWWMGTTGAWWGALLCTLYLPGVTPLLLEGEALLFLHPVMAIYGVMSHEFGAQNPIYPHLWLLCVLVYSAASIWFFSVAVMRVRRMRSD